MSYIDDSLHQLEIFEARIPWMYLDTVGKVTAGIGCMLPNIAAALKLPWMKGSRLATEDEVTAEFCRVTAMREGLSSRAYRGDLYLTDEAIDEELDARLGALHQELQAALPEFDSYPDPVKLALLDMAYNLGTSGLLHGYPHMIAAVKARNWQAAEAQCNRRGPSFTRNDWTRGCFEAAYKAAA